MHCRGRGQQDRGPFEQTGDGSTTPAILKHQAWTRVASQLGVKRIFLLVRMCSRLQLTDVPIRSKEEKLFHHFKDSWLSPSKELEISLYLGAFLLRSQYPTLHDHLHHCAVSSLEPGTRSDSRALGRVERAYAAVARTRSN